MTCYDATNFDTGLSGGHSIGSSDLTTCGQGGGSGCNCKESCGLCKKLGCRKSKTPCRCGGGGGKKKRRSTRRRSTRRRSAARRTGKRRRSLHARRMRIRRMSKRRREKLRNRRLSKRSKRFSKV